MKKNIRSEIGNLRLKAEELLKKNASFKGSFNSETEKERLLHELQVHQVELEIQNEELLNSLEKADTAASKYVELYDNSPCSYFRLSKEGEILELNLTAASMLGKERQKLIGTRFAFFITDNTKTIFSTFLQKVFIGKGRETCEVNILLNNNKHIIAFLSGIFTEYDGQCLVTVNDISDITNLEHIYHSRSHLLHFSENHTLDELLEETLNQAEYLTDSLVGFYHFVEDDQKSLYLKNWSTRTKRDFCKAEGKGSHYNLNMAGVWADCIRLGHPVIHNDYPSLENKKGMPSGHAYLKRELVVPVFRNRKITAVLGVGNKPEDYNEKDIETITMLADLAWDIAERKKENEDIVRQNELLTKLNHFAIELAMLSTDDNLEAFIAKKLKDLTGAVVIVFSDYNEEKRTTTVKHIEIEPGLLKNIISLLGKKLDKIHPVVSDEAYSEMVSEIIGTRKSLHEMSFGAIPLAASEAIQSMIKADSFIGLAYTIKGKLYGTSMLGLNNRVPETPGKILESFVSIAALSLQRRIVETSLRESQEKYKTLFMVIPDIIFIIDRETGKIEEVNDQAVKKYGISYNEFITLYNTDVSSEPKKTLAATKSTPDIIPIRYHKKKDGTVFPIEITSSTMEIKGRTKIIAVARDISRRLKSEELIKSKDVFLQTIYDHSGVATFIISVIGEGKYVYEGVNKTYEKLFGIKNKDIEGKTPDDLEYFFGKDTIAYAYSIYDKCIKTKEVNESEFEVPLPDGSKDWWVSRISPILDNDGNVYKLIGSSLNITFRKKAEKELKRKADELAKVNSELEQFTYANQELKQFAYSASHQLQEPIRTVSNYIQIIEEDYISLLDENAHKHINTIKAATNRMSVLIGSLLEYSRLGRDKKLVVVDCKELIESVINDIEYMIAASDSVIWVGEMPELNLYETEIRQLFQNLIINAIKFRKKGIQTLVQISSENINGKWKFSVKDNGIGIAPAHFERIFEIFQRLHSNAEYEGSGVGLAYCKKIVQLHQGEIWVDSKIGQGSTFHFTIPIIKS